MSDVKRAGKQHKMNERRDNIWIWNRDLGNLNDLYILLGLFISLQVWNTHNHFTNGGSEVYLRKST